MANGDTFTDNNGVLYVQWDNQWYPNEPENPDSLRPATGRHGGRHPQQETFNIPPRKGLLDRWLDGIAKKNSK